MVDVNLDIHYYLGIIITYHEKERTLHMSGKRYLEDAHKCVFFMFVCNVVVALMEVNLTLIANMFPWFEWGKKLCLQKCIKKSNLGNGMHVIYFSLYNVPLSNT